MERKYNVIVKDRGNKCNGVLKFNEAEWPQETSATLEMACPISGPNLDLVSKTKRTVRRWTVQLLSGKKSHNNHGHSILILDYQKTKTE